MARSYYLNAAPSTLKLNNAASSIDFRSEQGSLSFYLRRTCLLFGDVAGLVGFAPIGIEPAIPTTFISQMKYSRRSTTRGGQISSFLMS